ncbi:MAG TPA: hypothetical protein VLZ83_12295 [Edaphocola sp.]|nr:hypothetical protein [Edaphocola sp.]
MTIIKATKFKTIFILVIGMHLFIFNNLLAQGNISEIDSNQLPPAELFVLKNKYNQLGITGLLQTQFQFASEKGTLSFNGGNFSPNSNNRFMIRRGRLKFDFKSYTSSNKIWNQWVIQIDATEKGIKIRDAYATFFENKWELFDISAGLIFRPFGNELVYSSSKRESPERGRVSDILFGAGRDVGAILTLNPRKDPSQFKKFTLKVGVFNGPGLTGSSEFDSYKDVVVRAKVHNMELGKSGIHFSAGVSGLFGGVNNVNPVYYYSQTMGLVADSSIDNLQKTLKKHYLGADIQIQIPNRKGKSEFRAEYIAGKQLSTLSNTHSFGAYPILPNGTNEPLAIRNFDGAFFYYLQHLNSEKHQIVLKYDWYNPNTKLKSINIDGTNNTSVVDLAFQTIGGGYLFYIHPNAKLSFWYEHPINKATRIVGFTQDIKDDVFTCRLQVSF